MPIKTILLCISFLVSSLSFANDSINYTRALWFTFLRSPKWETQAEDTLQKAKTRIQDCGIFEFDILISKTPESHLAGPHTVAIPMTLFMKEDPDLVIALHVVTHLKSLQWAREKLDIHPPKTPELHAATNYDEKLNTAPVTLRVDDFIGVEDLQNYMFSFRVIEDQNGLIVPAGKETRLVEILEGGGNQYPIEEIPLARIVNQVELQMIGRVIKDIELDELDNERVTTLSEFFLSMVFLMVVDSRLKLFEKGWIRKPLRAVLWIGTFTTVYIDETIHQGMKALGFDLNKQNIEDRTQYQDAFMFLMASYEKSKLGNFNVEEFQRDFCFEFNLNLDLAQDIHLFSSPEEWFKNVDEMDERLNDYYKRRKEIYEAHFEKVGFWLNRLSQGKRYQSPDTGEIFYILPPRPTDDMEQKTKTAFYTSSLFFVGELAYTKLHFLKRKLYSGKLFGGGSVAALTIDYVFGIPDYNEIKITEMEKEILEKDLKKLQKTLPDLIELYDYMSNL